MTVKDLINELARLAPNLVVYLQVDGGFTESGPLVKVGEGQIRDVVTGEPRFPCVWLSNS